jgi:CheY-like chemotaxis protein
MGAPAPTVLVVEDDFDVREVIGEVLSHRGYHVVGAIDGSHALHLLRLGVRPRVILLDLMMMPMDGYGFREAQRADPSIADIPVIVMSAGDPYGEAVASLEAVDFLKKPVELATLLAAVGRVS